jgi:hypothetical protein
MTADSDESTQEGSERAAYRFAPLFVLAPARSLSSVVVAMLGQHPELYAFPELRLFALRRVEELLRAVAPGDGPLASERVAGLLRALAQLQEGKQTAGAVERAYRWLERRSHWGVESVFDHLLELVSPQTGVEKSPETSRTDGALQRASAAYPGARILHLVRHPWSTVKSMLEAWSSLSYWRVDREAAPQYCLNVWLEQHRRIAKMGKPLGAGRFMRIRAEDMVNRPLDVLPGFCSWMSISNGVESLDEMLHPERSRYASRGPVNAGGGYDPKFMANPRLRRVETPSPFLPDQWRVDDRVLRAVVDLAGKFGYECEGSSLSFGRQWREGFRRNNQIRLGLPRR